MIKPVKPGRLSGLSDKQIERSLERLFECPVDYSDYVANIYCVEQYDQPKYLVQDMRRIQHLGDVAVCARKGRAFVRLVFNEEAIDIISGARRERESEAETTSE